MEAKVQMNTVPFLQLVQSLKMKLFIVYSDEGVRNNDKLGQRANKSLPPRKLEPTQTLTRRAYQLIRGSEVQA